MFFLSLKGYREWEKTGKKAWKFYLTPSIVCISSENIITRFYNGNSIFLSTTGFRFAKVSIVVITAVAWQPLTLVSTHRFEKPVKMTKKRFVFTQNFLIYWTIWKWKKWISLELCWKMLKLFCTKKQREGIKIKVRICVLMSWENISIIRN